MIGPGHQCGGCGHDIPPNRNKGSRYCDRKCRPGYASRKTDVSQYPNLSCSMVGTINELKVCLDLAERGYEIFLPLNANASCDIVVLKDGKSLRVEVRTCYKSPSGRMTAQPLSKDNGRYDIFARVLPDQIIYEPELPEVSKR